MSTTASEAAPNAAAGGRTTDSTAMPLVILGTMEFGREGRESEKADRCLAQIKLYSMFCDSTGQRTKVLDTALMYQAGGSEKIIGSLAGAITHDMGDSGVFEIHTKINPWGPEGLSPASCRQQLVEWSRENLKPLDIDVLYLHAPDHKTPVQETLAAVNELHAEGHFKRLAISNYAAWQVAEMVLLCRTNGWVVPSLYQGMYNALTRDVERELLPCLKHFGIPFYAYNPLAGGLLAGRLSREAAKNPDAVKTPGRFFGNTWAKTYRDRFGQEAHFDATDIVQAALDRDGSSISLADASLRWLAHHSKLSSTDGIILGASSQAHLTANLASMQHGPLPEHIVDAFEEGWTRVHGSVCPSYFR